MSLVKSFTGWVRGLRSSADLGKDPAAARSRETGGTPEQGGDRGATTGPGESETFVGRVGGQDAGYAGETGAERRAEEPGSR